MNDTHVPEPSVLCAGCLVRAVLPQGHEMSVLVFAARLADGQYVQVHCSRYGGRSAKTRRVRSVSRVFWWRRKMPQLECVIADLPIRWQIEMSFLSEAVEDFHPHSLRPRELRMYKPWFRPPRGLGLSTIT
jgi:hypothetical protein